MSDQLDYEETRARLRAQLATSAAPHRVLLGIGRRWLGVVATLVVIACAVVVTVSLTRTTPHSEVTLVPSAGHEDSASSSVPAAAVGAAPVPTDPLVGRGATGETTAVVEATGVAVDPAAAATTPEFTDTGPIPGIGTAEGAPADPPSVPVPAGSRPAGAQSPAAPPASDPVTVPPAPVTPPPATVPPADPATPTGESPPGTEPGGGPPETID